MEIDLRTRRRDFLRLTAAAASLALAPRGFARNGRAVDPLRGIWWFYPSFLEHPEGPWGTCPDRNASPLPLWKACLSWLADHGVNSAFVHFGPFGSDLSPFAQDRVRTGWGFHYLLDFERFPEARTFDKSTLARNRELLNAICTHGKAVGCDVYTHHYNFSAPKPFVDGHHVDLLKVPVGSKRIVKDLYPGFCDQRQLLHRNLCWNSPLYRAFLVSCWEETCRVVPDLKGILVTPGENARCPCVNCVGATDDPGAPFATSKERLATLGNFVQVFVDTLKRAGREPMVRAWAAGKSRPWIEVFPKGVRYFLKYSYFDVVDCDPDPAIAEWVAAGHRIVATPEIQGGENGGPTLWRRPDYLPAVVSKSFAAGAEGVVACVNSEHGFLSTPRRVQHSPTVLFANAVKNPGKSDRELSVSLDRAIFGDVGADIHRVLEAACEIVFTMPRIVFEPEEGFTWQFAYTFFKDEWPGRLGSVIDADRGIAGDIATLKDVLSAARTRKFEEPFPASSLAGRRDPLEVLRQAAAKARAAEAELIELEKRVDESAAADFDLVKISVKLCRILGDEWTALLAARICFEACMGPNGAAAREALGKRCLVEFDKSIAAIDECGAVARTLPHGLVSSTLVERSPRKRSQRLEEKAEASRRLGLG